MDQSETLRILLIKRRNVAIVNVGVVRRTHNRTTTTYCYSFFFLSFPRSFFAPSYQSNFMATFERVKINNVYIYWLFFFLYLSMDTIKFWPLASFFLVVEKKENGQTRNIDRENGKKNKRLNSLLMSFVDCHWMNSFLKN